MTGEVSSTHTGIRAYRIYNIAIVDVAVTVLASMLIAKFSRVPLVYVLVSMFLLGIVMHRLFGVRTQVDRWLFPDPT